MISSEKKTMQPPKSQERRATSVYDECGIGRKLPKGKSSNESGDGMKPLVDVYDFGVHREKGSRSQQEDRYSLVDQTPQGWAFFAVYDGHGGDCYAEHARQRIHELIFGSPQFAAGNVLDAISWAFEQEDNETFRELAEEKGIQRGGTTAVVALLNTVTRILYIGNVGDSRCVIAKRKYIDEPAGTSNGGNPNRLYDAERLTVDHKPDDDAEMNRIESSGGVVLGGRVEGDINMSRALGDHQYKYPYNGSEADFITNKPFLRELEIAPEEGHDFIVLASDGLWNVMEDEQVVNKVGEMWREGLCAKEMCKRLIGDAVEASPPHGSDNITVMMAFFNKNRNTAGKTAEPLKSAAESNP